MLGIAFVTLFERKFLGSRQKRQGPAKAGIKGLFQPFRDAIKLFNKEFFLTSKSLPFYFFWAPVLRIFLMLVVWIRAPSLFRFCEMELRLVFIIACLRLGVFLNFMAGWASGCKYSGIGGVRRIAQTISYEVRFFLVLLSLIILIGGFRFREARKFSSVWMVCVSPILCFVWFISRLGEANRTPFDFREGESELVSGFNSEYRAGPFALFFLREYGFILFLRFLIPVLFLGGLTFFVRGGAKVVTRVILFIWVRASLPRIRYDKLMDLAWKKFLPLSLRSLLFFRGLIFFLV